MTHCYLRPIILCENLDVSHDQSVGERDVPHSATYRRRVGSASWIIGHWVGTFHALARTGLVTAAWYLFPTLRFVVIPAVIVMIYAVTIVILEARWRRMRQAKPGVADRGGM